MEKTNIKLSGILGLYLLVIAVLIGVVTVAAVVIFSNVAITRADDTEKQVEDWIEASKASGEFDLVSFPAKADYVIEADGKEIGSHINKGNAEKLEKFITGYKANGQDKRLNGQDVYRTVVIGDSTIYVHYSLGVPGEWLAFGFTVLAYIAVIVIPSVILISKLKELIYKLAEEKWRKEYEIKQEMAQIAHDLKTPLTVIRGNADLLLEKEQDDDSKESIEAIVKNAERIARSVLEILEKDETVL
ncbi:MAG: hypothetical protein J5802_06670 [Butyrivibrio sp.]|nr:hypothetical protein [Butyrivibrio sp.]